MCGHEHADTRKHRDVDTRSYQGDDARAAVLSEARGVDRRDGITAEDGDGDVLHAVAQGAPVSIIHTHTHIQHTFFASTQGLTGGKYEYALFNLGCGSIKWTN